MPGLVLLALIVTGCAAWALWLFKDLVPFAREARNAIGRFC